MENEQNAPKKACAAPNSPDLENTFHVSDTSHFGSSPDLVDMAEFPSWIIYEDDNFLALNKPGWLVCHPSKNGPLSSLVGAAREYLKADTLHLISRLDRETSGVVVLAKNHETASIAQSAMMEKGRIGKKYAVFLRGNLPDCVTVAQPLSDDRNSLVGIKTCCAVQRPRAKKAVTVFRALTHSQNPNFEPCTLAEAELLTGRKHQIRAHALWLGHQVVADKLYGDDETIYLDFADYGFTEKMAEILPMRRQALHCYFMDFSAVFDNLKFFAPLPDDMLRFAKSRKLPIPDFLAGEQKA